MADNLVVSALALGIFVIFIAAMIPTLATAPTAEQNQTTDLTLDDPHELDIGLELTLDAVDETNTTVDVTARDVSTSDSAQTTLTDNETERVDVDDETVGLSLASITDNTTASVRTTYDSTYGWSSESQFIADQLGFLLVLVAFLLMCGMVWVVIS